MKNLINVMEVLLSVGYSEKSVKGTKTRQLNSLGIENASTTFMVEPEVIEKMLNKIGTGKTDKAVPSNRLLASKEYLKMTTEHKEPVKVKGAKKSVASVEIEELKREISMTKKELGTQRKEMENLKAEFEALKTLIDMM